MKLMQRATIITRGGSKTKAKQISRRGHVTWGTAAVNVGCAEVYHDMFLPVILFDGKTPAPGHLGSERKLRLKIHTMMYRICWSSARWSWISIGKKTKMNSANQHSNSIQFQNQAHKPQSSLSFPLSLRASISKGAGDVPPGSWLGRRLYTADFWIVHDSWVSSKVDLLHVLRLYRKMIKSESRRRGDRAGPRVDDIYS